ncbi:MAG: TonB-dependent receptor [Williamsia sp.]|nr:TonB-dependent receptor [Williamsia sp.]
MRKTLLFSFFLFICSLSVFAQNRTISGSVLDEKGEPLIGATVAVVGTGVNTTTGITGNFQLQVATSARQLEVTYVGFTTQRVVIGNRTTLEVRLLSSNPNLSEVVVVAYGTAKKEALTGSIGQIGAKEIRDRPINNVTNAVEGAIAGVVVTSANGQPGSGNTIRVRGFGSVNASLDPLFVVDGVPYLGGTSNINPDDVENITILKDAASTALYGSRAANGVVIITTKKGQKGRNNVSVRVLQGVASRGLSEYDRLDAFQYYPVMWEAYRNSLVYPATGTGISLDSANKVASGLTTRSSIKDLLAYNPFNVAANTIVGTDGKINPNARLLYGDDLDWTKDLMRKGSRKDYSINFNGGGDKSDYFMSAGYVKENGYTLKTDFERYTTRLNVNIQPKTWLKTGLNISGNYSVSNLANDGGSTNFVNPFYYSRNVGPIYPVYLHNMTTGAYVLDNTGNKIWDLGNYGTSAIGLANGVPNRTSGGFAGRHALAENTLNDNLYRRTVVSARDYVDISFLKDFKFTTNVAVDFQNQANSSYENTLVGDGAPAGRSRRIAASVTGFTFNQLLNYGKNFGDHRVDALIGHESFNRRETEVNAFKQGQSLTGNTELGNFTTINSATSLVDKNTIESYFSRLNYSFNNKYYASGSLRRDGNSRFSKLSRWGTFWSAGAGWNINREEFMKSVEWVDLLKLRSSYGIVGNAEGVGFYAYQGVYVFNNNANEPGITQSQTAIKNNDSLTWEGNKQFDLGIDFSLFKGRVNGSLEYYKRQTVDLLFDVPLPLSSGALSLNKNTATMYNRGFELQLDGNIVQSKNFVWNMGVNLSTVTSKITKMPDNSKEIISGTKKLSEGHSQYDFWLRTYYGVDPADGAALYVSANTATATNRRFINNKNGTIDTVTTLASNGKFEYQGTAIPDLYGSFTESFTFKGFTLSALFTFQLGGKTYDALYQGLMSAGTYGSALHTDILNRWQKAGDVTNVPRLDAGRTTDFNAQSSRWLIDASYFNIRTVTLAYTLPKPLLSRLSINNSQVFVSAENAAFFSKRKGMNNQQAFTGVTSNAYPPARVITGGISLNF